MEWHWNEVEHCGYESHHWLLLSDFDLTLTHIKVCLNFGLKPVWVVFYLFEYLAYLYNSAIWIECQAQIIGSFFFSFIEGQCGKGWGHWLLHANYSLVTMKCWKLIWGLGGRVRSLVTSFLVRNAVVEVTNLLAIWQTEILRLWKNNSSGIGWDWSWV